MRDTSFQFAARGKQFTCAINGEIFPNKKQVGKKDHIKIWVRKEYLALKEVSLREKTYYMQQTNRIVLSPSRIAVICWCYNLVK